MKKPAKKLDQEEEKGISFDEFFEQLPEKEQKEVVHFFENERWFYGSENPGGCLADAIYGYLFSKNAEPSDLVWWTNCLEEMANSIKKLKELKTKGEIDIGDTLPYLIQVGEDILEKNGKLTSCH